MIENMISVRKQSLHHYISITIQRWISNYVGAEWKNTVRAYLDYWIDGWDRIYKMGD